MTNNSERRRLRLLLIVCVAVPGLVGAVTAPAHAGSQTAPAPESVAATAAIPAEAVPAPGYPTTTLADVQAAQTAAATETPPVTAAQTTAFPGAYMHDATAPWIRPVAGRITSRYGPRPVICNSAGCSNTFHDGIDFGSSCGTAIKAISPGRVTFAANAGSFGNRVIVDHGGGVESIYGHALNASFAVSVGQLVKAGTVVASVGATGVATGCHLDLKIRVGGVYIDPGPWMNFRGVTL